MFLRFRTAIAILALLGAFVTTGCEQPDWTDPAYVNKQLMEGDATSRQIAFQNLSELEDEKRTEIVPGLVKVYEDAGSNQKDAMELLVQMRDERAKEAYLAELTTDATGYAGAAAEALGEIGAREAIPKMLELLDKSEKPDVKVSIIAAFRHMPDPSLVGPLVEILKLDVDNNPISMHSYACEVLKEVALSSPGAIEESAVKQITLAVFYANQTNQSLDKACGLTVQALGDKAVPHLLAAFKGEREDIQMLLMKYDTEDSPFPPNHSKLIATQRLASMRAEEAVDPILADLNGTKEAPKSLVGNKAVSWRMREGQITSEELYALGDIGADKGLDVLTAVVKGERVNDEWDDITDGLVELQLRQDAAFSLVRLGNREALPALLSMAKDGVINDLEKRSAMLESRGQAVKDIERYQFNWMMAQAYADLATSENKEDFMALVASYKKDYPDVGSKMEEFVVMFDVMDECDKGEDAEKATCFAGKLEDPNKLIREKAAWELVRLPAGIVGPVLVENLGTEDLETREILTFGLYRAPSKEAIEKIDEILEAESSEGESHALDHFRLQLTQAWLENQFN